MEEEVSEQTLIPCSTCGRTFLPLPLKKHAPICEKNALKKRKTFDSLKQRVEGTDLAQFHQKSYIKKQEPVSKTPEKPQKNNQWEENHKKLVDAIRSAKGSSRVMSPNKQIQLTSNQRCPFCERQFGHKAFDRHVEWCKEHQTRVQKSPANVLLAKERLEARIKYKVPLLNKSKKVTIKEKYSNINRTESVCSVKSSPTPSVLRRNLSVRKPKSVMDLGSQNQTKKVGGKTNSVTALNKEPEEQSKSNKYDPFKLAERQFMELLECDTHKTSPTTKKSQTHTPRPHTAVQQPSKLSPKKVTKSAEITKNRASAHEYQEDDFEYLENLLNEQFNNDSTFCFELNKRNKDDFNVTLNHRTYSDDTSSIDSNLINENDNLSIPEHFKFDRYSSNSSEDTDTTLQNDNVEGYSLKHSKTPEPKACVKSSVQKVGKTKISNSSLANGDGIQVHRRTKNPDASSPLTKGKTKESTNKVLGRSEVDLPAKASDLFAVDDQMYAEYKIYEEMYLKGKEQSNTRKQRNKNSVKSYGIKILNDEYADQTNKISDDSAYGSLNRNNPKTELSSLRQHRDSTSSSGSECINPPVVNCQRMSKFCHECGNKYPLMTAKFCPECGVKRLIL